MKIHFKKEFTPLCELAFLKAAKSYSKGPYKGCLALFVVGASQGWMLLAHESFKPALALPLILTTRVHAIKRKYFNTLCSWCCLKRPQKLKSHMFFDVGSGGGGCRRQKSMCVFFEFCCLFRKYHLYKNLSLKIEKNAINILCNYFVCPLIYTLKYQSLPKYWRNLPFMFATTVFGLKSRK